MDALMTMAPSGRVTGGAAEGWEAGWLGVAAAALWLGGVLTGGFVAATVGLGALVSGFGAGGAGLAGSEAAE